MRKIKIDATDVPEEIRRGGGGTHVPEGEYIVKLNNVELKTTKDESGRYLRWEVVILEPKKYKGKRVFGNTSLKKDALWSLRNLIFAATKKNIAGRVAAFDPESLLGKIVGAAISDNEYENKSGDTKLTSQVDTFFPKDEVNAADEDDEEDDDEDVEEEDEDEEDEEEEEEDEEEEVKPRKKAKKKSKKSEDDDDDLEEVDLDDI